MEERKIYEDIARRTDGDIYIGVVGPVRTGKSTFIKRVMESLVIPNIDNVYRRERARDELPQSGSGRTIMTAEPKFVPEEAVTVSMDASAAFQVRLIDCVGYMVPGAVGQLEGETERMVTTPWFDHEIPMSEAAEVGTRKVIAEHSTIGIVVTTDGTITEIPREDYLEAEERVIRELKELGKQVLYEFPLKEMDLFLPPWVDALPQEHPIKAALYEAIRQGAGQLGRIRDVEQAVASMRECEQVSQARVTSIDLGTGLACASLELPRSLFYDTISQQSGFQIGNDGDLMALLTQLAQVKASYDKVADALKEVEETGYGIVVPSIDSLVLEEPEIVRQGGRYGVRLKASAPSIHMIRADIETEVSPIVGSEKQSEEMIHYLLQEFEGDTAKIWQSNIFGKSFHELVGEDLNAKVKRMPEDAREKLRETLQRIINEGSGGLICIIL